VPRSAQTVVSVPFWPNRASSSNHTSTRSPGRAAATSAAWAGSFFQALLGLRVGLGVARPGPQRLEPEAVQQVVGRLERAADAELLLEDAADVLAAQGADPVVGGRAGPQPASEPALLVGGERGLRPAAGPVGEGGAPGGVVAGDPGADLPLGQEHLGGDLGRGVAEEGQPDGGEPAGEPGPRLGTDQAGEFVGGVVGFDVPGGLQPGYRHPR
jgi:hypothetical protein